MIRGRRDGFLDLVLVSTPLGSDETHRGLCPSLSTLTLGSYLVRQGAAVRVFDPSVEVETAGMAAAAVLDEVAHRCVAMQPRFLGLSCMSPVEGKFGAALARRVKALIPSLPVIMGGLWAASYANQILRRLPDVDAVVEGAGEHTAEALLRASHGRQPDFGAAPGIAWRGGRTAPAPPFGVELSVPLDLKLLLHPERYDIMVYLSSRGCPFRCNFCSEPLMFPHYIDEPLEKVRSDIDALAAVGKPYYFWMCDPIFGFSPRRVDEICQLMGEKGFQFLVESRVDVLKPAMVAEVARAGCRVIYFGLESGACRSLIELDKCRDRSHFERYRDNARALVEACANHGIVPMLGVMNPVPGDTPEDLTETLDFLHELVAISSRINPELGLFILPLRCRLDMGTPFQTRWAELAARGVTRECDEEAIFDDMFVVRASPSVGPEEGEAFRRAAGQLWTPIPRAMEILSRSWPRPYLEMDWC